MSTRRSRPSPRRSNSWWRALWRVRLLRLLVLGAALFLFSRYLALPLAKTIDPPAWKPSNGNGPRVVTWNLRNFNGIDFRSKALQGQAASGSSHHEQAHDLERLRQSFSDLAADVLILQEIRNPAALTNLLPDHELWTSPHGGHGGQHLGIALRRGHVRWFEEPRQHDELTLKGRVRPAVSVRVPLPDGEILRIMGVHLKAKQEGLAARREQWLALRDLIRQHDREFPSDKHLLIAGDFNVTGGTADGQTFHRSDEERELKAVFAEIGVRPLAVQGGCSAYWDGERRDAWREATQLDFVWVRGLTQWIDASTQALPMGPCARHACARARTTKAKPDPDLEWISDHCPLVVDFHRVAP